MGKPPPGHRRNLDQQSTILFKKQLPSAVKWPSWAAWYLSRANGSAVVGTFNSNTCGVLYCLILQYGKWTFSECCANIAFHKKSLVIKISSIWKGTGKTTSWELFLAFPFSPERRWHSWTSLPMSPCLGEYVFPVGLPHGPALVLFPGTLSTLRQALLLPGSPQCPSLDPYPAMLAVFGNKRGSCLPLEEGN